MDHKIYINIAFEIAKASKANNRKVGCILVKYENIISFGYNGTPSGFDNNCEINGKTIPEVLHAESNAITKCAKMGISLNNSTLYCTLMPCLDCSKLIIQSGIKNVYYSEKYKCTKGIEILKKAKINVYGI